jgi:hypothetical protein
MTRWTVFRSLDVSFNLLRAIPEVISCLSSLEVVYFIQNKITEISSLDGVPTTLKSLELGGNRIRVGLRARHHDRYTNAHFRLSRISTPSSIWRSYGWGRTRSVNWRYDHTHTSASSSGSFIIIFILEPLFSEEIEDLIHSV